MPLFMTVALIHNANALLPLCRLTQISRRHKLIFRAPLVCDKQSGSEKRIHSDYKRVSNRPANTRAHGITAIPTFGHPY